MDYGAVGNGVAKDTAAIQAALNACNAAGGGTVELPAGETFLSNPITVHNNTNLEIDGELLCEPLGSYSTPGTSLVTYSNDTNVELSGSGLIEGQGGVGPNGGWWGDAAIGIAPVATRPRLVRITGCNTVLVENLSLNNSPSFEIVAGSTPNNGVTINNVKIFAPSSDTNQVAAGELPSHNTDGIDVTGYNYLIENCNISNGDDCIALEAGGGPTGNVTITNCTFGTGHGVSIGSGIEFGVDGLTVTNCTFNNTTNGIRLKSSRNIGGLVQNITYSNLTMTNVRYPILFYSYYTEGLPTDPSADPAQPVTATTPIWQNISISNFKSTNSFSNSVAAIIFGLPEEPIANVSFNNVQITAHTGMEIDHARNITFDASSHLTIASGADLISTPTSLTKFPQPYDATILASNFQNTDIGTPTVPIGTSSSIYDPDTTNWQIMGDGSGLDLAGGVGDELNYSSLSVTGDASLDGKLVSLTNPTGTAPEAGFMFRESADPGSPFVAIVEDPEDLIYLFSRSTENGQVTNDGEFENVGPPNYILLSRVGNTFLGSFSSDNKTWTQFGSVTLSGFATTADLGLYATSGANGSLVTANFSSVTFNNAPVVSSFSVNGGAIQRSMDTLVSIVFDQPVNLADDAVSLVQRATGGGSPTAMAFDLVSPDNGTTWNLTFPSYVGSSLPNGIYDLTVTASDVAGVQYGMPMPADETFTFHRLFGDADGNGVVNNADYFAFKKAFAQTIGSPGYNSIFDYDGNGVINNGDYFQFKLDFGVQYIY
jgi:hypothetical protein